MKTDFYIVPCNEKDYNLIFHQPTSRISRINKNIKESDLDIEKLNKQLSNVPIIEPNPNLEFGKGKITLTFMSARTCNLGCKYCFADEGEYKSDDSKPKFYNYELYLKSLNNALNIYPEGVKRIGFFGGEPLLNFNEIRKFIPECIKIFQDKGLDIPMFSITSNLTLLTDEMADFFNKYHVLINVSLDGNQELNDIARKYKHAQGSVYCTVYEKCKILEDKNVRYSIVSTLNKNHISNYQTGDAIKWIKEIEKLNYHDISIIPVETEKTDLAIINEKDIDNFILFTKELVNYYLEKVISGDTNKLAPFIILPMVQIVKKTYLRSCTAGQSFFCDTDGNIYPCHMFCNDKKYLLGNVNNEMDIEMSEEIANCSKDKSSECSLCIARNVCAVWCKGLQYLYNDDIWKVCKIRCIFQRIIVEECLSRLSDHTQKDMFLNNYKLYSISSMNSHYNKGLV